MTSKSSNRGFSGLSSLVTRLNLPVRSVEDSESPFQAGQTSKETESQKSARPTEKTTSRQDPQKVMKKASDSPGMTPAVKFFLWLLGIGIFIAIFSSGQDTNQVPVDQSGSVSHSPSSASDIFESIPSSSEKGISVERGEHSKLTRRVQKVLNQLDYDSGPVDGIYGPKTKAAIEEFQREHNVPITGEISRQLLTLLQKKISTIPSHMEGKGLNKGDDRKRWEQYRVVEDSLQSEAPITPTFNKSDLPLPNSGEARRHTSAVSVAPFKIRTRAGSNYLVKLEDANSGHNVMDVFVRGGDTIEVSVPLGSYVVKYAAGNTWYGYEHYFGSDTSYSKADSIFRFRIDGHHINGYTITLYSVPDGNLSTSRINPSQF